MTRVHQHLIVRAEIMVPPDENCLIAYADEPNCTIGWISVDRWMRSLISDINMTVLVGPHSVYCKMDGNRGCTAIAAIETSHIVLHTWDEMHPAQLQLDIYTCSPLDLEVVWQALALFEPIKLEYKFLDRSEGLQTVMEGIHDGDSI